MRGQVWMVFVIAFMLISVIPSHAENKNSQLKEEFKNRQFVLSVITPNGGEVWTGGTTHQIEIATGLPPDGSFMWAELDIEYSTDGGNSWTPITSDYLVIAMQTHTVDWNVPTVDTTQALVRVTGYPLNSSYSPESDTSDSYFTIDSTPPTITSTTPADGATDVDPNSLTEITITFSESMNQQMGSVTIDNNAQLGSWNWVGNTLHIPVSNLDYGKTYNVTVRDMKDSSDPGNDIQPNPYVFSFRTKYDILRSVEVISPNGGEVWSGGTAHRIQIKITGGTPPFTVDFYLSTDGGATYPIYIGQETISTFSYSKYWIVNTTDTSSARVKVVVTDNTGASKEDTSDGDFVIDSTPPSVISYYPPDGSNTVPKDAYIYVNFSEAMNRTSVENGFSLEMEGGINVSGNITWTSGTNMVFIPDSELLTDTKYYLNITNAKDASDPGNVMPTFSISFTTEPVIGIAIDSPVVGSRITGGAQIPIKWLIRGGTAPYTIKIYFSTDSGATYSLVDTVVQNSSGWGSYIWTVPTINSDTCRLKLNLTDSEGKATDSEMRGDFTIDSTPPDVVSIKPDDGSMGVSIHTNITVEFSEPMNKTSVESSFRVEAHHNKVNGIIKWQSDSKLVFIPSSPLDMNTTYWINITGAKDSSEPGNPLPDFSAKFTTYPELTGKFLSPSSSDRWSGGYKHTVKWICKGGKSPYKVDILYSKDGGSNYVGYVVRDMNCTEGINTYDWEVPKINTSYLKLKIMISDSDGNSKTEYSDNIVVDSRPPVVVAISPKNGEENVSLDTSIEIYFSEEMNKTSVINALTVECNGEEVSGEIKWYGNYMEFVPEGGYLKPRSKYWINISANAKDNSTPGNRLKESFSAYFSTLTSSDNIPPYIVRVFPSDGLKGVPLNVSIEVEFSESMFKKSVESSFNITPYVNGSYKWFGNTLKFIPSQPLMANTTYRVTIYRYAMDSGYNELGENYTWEFTTASSGINGAIEGFVKNKESQPIENVSISLSLSGNVIKEATTNTSGYFWIGDLPPGTYTISFKKQGYEPKNMTVEVEEGAVKSLGSIVLMEISGGGGGNGGGGGENTSPTAGPFNWLLIIVIVAVIIAIVIGAIAAKKHFAAPAAEKKKEVCPICGENFVEGQILYRCPQCGTVMHASCAKESGFCPVCGKEVVTKKKEKKPAVHEAPICEKCGKQFQPGDMGYRCPKCKSVFHISCLKGYDKCPICGTPFPEKLLKMLSEEKEEAAEVASEEKNIEEKPEREEVAEEPTEGEKDFTDWLLKG